MNHQAIIQQRYHLILLMEKYNNHSFLTVRNLFEKLNIIPLFFICLTVKFIISGLFGEIIALLLPNQLEHSMSDLPAYESFAITVLFGPFLETFIFQFLLFYLGGKLRLNIFQIVIVSSILFAISHHMSLAYVVLTFFSGLFYNIVYINIKNKYKKSETAFFFVAGIHAIYNFVVWLNMLFMK